MIELQIDVIKENNDFVTCNLYAGGRRCEILLLKQDYDRLVYEGFFIRNGKTEDSAGVLNTTKVFVEKEIEE